MNALTATMSEFVRLHRDGTSSPLSSAEGPAALLRAKLSEQHSTSWPAFSVMRSCAALLALVAAGLWITGKPGTIVEASPVPRTDLTPGATTAITAGEACQAAPSQFNRDVPVALQEAVFREYGIRNPRPRAYEVDYLITPELGGANDIRNLWPEPYYTPVWNAHVKDALEERLHDMVCSGAIDLATAQHDLSTDWIAAYRKYFRTNRPL